MHGDNVSAIQAMSLAHTRKQKSQMIGYAGNGSCSGSTGWALSRLGDCQSWTQPVNAFHLGRLQAISESRSVATGRQQEPAARFCENGIEGETRLPGPGNPRDRHDTAMGYVHIYALQIVLRRTTDLNSGFAPQHRVALRTAPFVILGFMRLNQSFQIPRIAQLVTIGLTAFSCVIFSTAALSAQMTMRGSAQQGRVLFHSSAVSTNGLSCIHCHADFDEGRRNDGHIRAGHSLYNSASRQNWWGQEPEDPDRYEDIAHASVFCVENFMRNPQKLTAQQLLNLQAYLQEITKHRVKAVLTMAPAADKTGQYSGFDDGDRITGRAIFFAACHACHPNGDAGIAPLSIPRDKPAAFYARKIREGDGLGTALAGVDPNAFDPEGENYMPFFGADRLSNAQIRDLIAFIKSLPPPVR
jgi:mono/diheme cytochrome c family protein